MLPSTPQPLLLLLLPHLISSALIPRGINGTAIVASAGPDDPTSDPIPSYISFDVIAGSEEYPCTGNIITTIRTPLSPDADPEKCYAIPIVPSPVPSSSPSDPADPPSPADPFTPPPPPPPPGSQFSSSSSSSSQQEVNFTAPTNNATCLRRRTTPLANETTPGLAQSSSYQAQNAAGANESLLVTTPIDCFVLGFFGPDAATCGGNSSAVERNATGNSTQGVGGDGNENGIEDSYGVVNGTGRRVGADVGDDAWVFRPFAGEYGRRRGWWGEGVGGLRVSCRD